MIGQNNWTGLLLAWFEKNRRSLPWREGSPRDPYRVWVAEIMLQQTRTEVVKEYFKRWMKEFPTVKDLAQAPEEKVLRLWQGLGYYSRARNLHKAARQIVLDYGGKLPADMKKLRSLPGIGAYTAGAVCSLAFGQQTPAVDGNLLRVLARLYGVEDDITSTAGRKKITALAARAIPADRPGDFNEALMDLGAEICLPKIPRCPVCPLREQCTAHLEDKTAELPFRSPRKKQKEFFAACGLVERDGHFLLYKRPDRGMLASMWEFPMVLQADSMEKAKKLLEEKLQSHTGEEVWQHMHVFTHQIWQMEAWIMEIGTPFSGEHRWVTPEEWKKLPLAGPHARLAEALTSFLKEKNMTSSR